MLAAIVFAEPPRRRVHRVKNGEAIEAMVARLGGRERVARACDITPDAVRKWEVIGIPPKHWPVIVCLTGGEIGFEELAAMPRPPAGRAA